MRNNWLLFFIFIGLLTGTILLLSNNFPGALEGVQDYGNLISFVALLMLITAGIFRGNINWTFLLKTSVIWLAIAFVLLAGYSYQYDLKIFFNRIAGNIAPSLAQNNGNGSVTIYAGQNGHFIVNALVNGATVQFLVDTGASDVVLTYADAQRAGIDTSTLNYNSIVQTANGTTSTAFVTLNQIQIGSIIVANVPAGISQINNLDMSLLGMSFLTKLGSYNVSQGVLTMSQ
jgi:aspartyl protease family protein